MGLLSDPRGDAASAETAAPDAEDRAVFAGTSATNCVQPDKPQGYRSVQSPHQDVNRGGVLARQLPSPLGLLSDPRGDAASAETAVIIIGEGEGEGEGERTQL